MISYVHELAELILLNGHFAKCDLQMRCNHDQNSDHIPHRNKISKSKILMEANKSLDSQSNPEHKIDVGGINT
jgi:hypothetical protein